MQAGIYLFGTFFVYLQQSVLMLSCYGLQWWTGSSVVAGMHGRVLPAICLSAWAKMPINPGVSL